MPQRLVTSTTLLEGLADAGNRSAWQRFVDRYRPLVVAYACGKGVPATDAEDVAQKSLLAFQQGFREGRYRRERGRLSSWLFGIVTHQIQGHRRQARRLEVQEPSTAGTGLLAREPAGDELDARWEEQWRAAVLRACLAEIRGEVEPATMRAFELFGLRNRPVEDVARELGMTPNAVYGAKRRVLERVRAVLPLIEDAF